MAVSRDRRDGEPVAWDDIWAHAVGADAEIFRRGKPRTLREFWLRCYSDDLWGALERVREAGDVPPRCVELGAGRGTLSKYLRRRGCDVTMVDLSERARALAIASFERDSLGPVDYVIADVRESGLPSASFDCVLSVGVLEHFEDPVPMLRESLRLLRPRGLMFHIVVPSVPPSRAYLAKLVLAPWRLAGGLIKRWLAPAPVSPDQLYRTSYPRRDYASWVTALGGRDVACLPYNPYHRAYDSALLERWIAVPAYALHHAIKRKFGTDPVLRTHAELALCDLVVAYKP